MSNLSDGEQGEARGRPLGGGADLGHRHAVGGSGVSCGSGACGGACGTDTTEPMGNDELARQLLSVPKWDSMGGRSLERTFNFANRDAAYTFLVNSAYELKQLAAELDLDPDVEWGYCVVKIKLTQHSAGNTLTNPVFTLARSIDGVSPEKILGLVSPQSEG